MTHQNASKYIHSGLKKLRVFITKYVELAEKTS